MASDPMFLPAPAQSPLFASPVIRTGAALAVQLAAAGGVLRGVCSAWNPPFGTTMVALAVNAASAHADAVISNNLVFIIFTFGFVFLPHLLPLI
jgi:hypothetical protein